MHKRLKVKKKKKKKKGANRRNKIAKEEEKPSQSIKDFFVFLNDTYLCASHNFHASDRLRLFRSESAQNRMRALSQ